ncbi:MAG: hypothetical protein ACRDMV_19570 [Streptosporangiales bacterium]
MNHATLRALEADDRYGLAGIDRRAEPDWPPHPLLDMYDDAHEALEVALLSPGYRHVPDDTDQIPDGPVWL